MRVLVVDESAERADVLRAALFAAGYEVTASLSSPLALLHTIERLRPEVIVIDTDSPSRDVLEHLVVMSQHTPRPVVMFAADRAPTTIREATRAGEPHQGHRRRRGGALRGDADLRTQLAEARERLAERKLVERAKGLLLKSRGIDEEAAYALLRKLAMDRQLKLAELARELLRGA